jgi:hypothetical protein
MISCNKRSEGCILTSERAKEPLGPALYSLGDMVWVRIGNYPYWPAMVGVPAKFNFFRQLSLRKKIHDSDFFYRTYGMVHVFPYY